MTLTILHLSDLHMSERSFADQKIVLSCLFDDLSSQRTAGQKIDLIFFSGDLVAKGNYSKENKELVENEFFKPLLEATGVESSHLFLVPGNHDFQQTKISSVIRPAFDSLDSIEKTNDFFDGLENTPYLAAGFDSYKDLVDRIITSKPIISTKLYSAYKVDINNRSIGICCINSAWKSTAAPNDADYGKLQVGQRQLDILIENIKECQLKLAILHHPLNWLSPFDQSQVQLQLYKNFDAIFYGHNHNANSIQIAGPHYSTFVSNSGCLYQSRDWFNGYSIIQRDSESTWIAKVREFYSGRDTFDVSTRFAENGEASFKTIVDRSSMEMMQLPSVDYMTAVLDSVNGHLLTNTISDVAPKNLGAIFVSPRLCHISEKQLNEDSSNNGTEIKYLSLRDLQSNNKPIFFVGQKEIGKTTLLHHICSECNNFQSSEIPSFGCYINLEAVKPTVASLLEAIVSFSKGAYRKAEFIELLNSGRMTVCFDNLLVHDEKLLSSLADFLKTYPTNRFYFSISETFQSSLSQRVIPKLNLESDVVYIHSFGRGQTRSLVAKWFGDTDDAKRERVDSLLASLRRLNVPRTPFLISIMLWVQEKNISFNPVNQAEIIDVLVDGILDKLNESKALSGYDSTAKRGFLTELSFAMHEAGVARFSHNKIERFAVDFFSNKGLPSASGPFISELMSRGILIDLGEEISFKFDCLRAFFLSTNIKDSPEFFKYAMTPSGFLKLGEELDYYTGKNRNDRDALVGALNVLEGYCLESGIDLDLNLFDDISLAESPISSTCMETLEKALLGERPSFEKQEELLDQIDRPYQAKSDISNVDADRSAVDKFFSSLLTASAILRNSELLNDADFKNEAYSKLTRYWCQMLLVVVAIVEYCFDEQEKLAIQETIPDMPDEYGKYIMKMFIPNAIFAMARESLGTTKLELMIRQDIEHSSESICKLFSTILYSDLELKGRISLLKDLIDQPNASRFLIELVFFKLLHIFMFKNITSHEADKTKQLLAELFAKINNNSAFKNQRSIDNFKSNFIAGITRKKLIKDFNSGK